MPKKAAKQNSYQPVGIVAHNERIGLLCLNVSLLRASLWVYWSKDGTSFNGTPEKITVTLQNKRLENISKCHSFSISKTGPHYVLTYIRKTGAHSSLITATASTPHHFKVVNELPHVKDKSVVAAHYYKDSTHLMYTGGLFIGNATFKTHEKGWHINPELIFTSRPNSFDEVPLTLMGAYATKRGIVVIYDATYKDKDTYVVQAGAVLLKGDEPGKILWRGDMPLWKELVKVSRETITPLGAIYFNNELFFYWTTSEKTVLKASLPAIFTEEEGKKAAEQKTSLKRHPHNPIMHPASHNEWESEAVFNPAAFYDDGEVHLIYRAIGSNGISVFGYSASDDGLTFKKRLSKPIFEPTEGFDLPDPKKMKTPAMYNPEVYASGGGWGGCEDPRAVKINNRIYVTYVAFCGWDSIRIALTSISLKDFRKGKWNWKKPVYLSPPQQTHKNWVLFPEKINGKFAILHGIAPNILIDYIDDLDNIPSYIQSERPQGPQPGRIGFWDGKVRGVGPPPIKTRLGWLILYHATDPLEPHKYKLGAMILDLKNPRKILYRTSHPILTPDMHYENEGKPGIVYASGAIAREGNLYVYYGGGDKVVCVATVKLDEFLDDIVQDVNLPFLFTNIKVD